MMSDQSDAAPVQSAQVVSHVTRAGNPAHTGPSMVSKVFFVIGTMVLPLLAILIELAGRTLSNMYHDPIPTWGHVLMLACVPIAFIVGEYYLAHGHDQPRRRWARAAFVLNGYALTISQIYLLVYIPFLPVALLGVLAVGLGLLPLAPLFCTIGGYAQFLALRGKRGLGGLNKGRPAMLTLAGVCLALGVMALLEVPPILTDHAIAKASSGIPAERAEGLSRLRALGADEAILDLCYDRRRKTGFLSAGFVDFDGFGDTKMIGQRRFLPFFGPSADGPSNVKFYRELYFRVTGRPFNNVPPPSSRFDVRSAEGERFVPETWQRERMISNEIGGESVAARVRGVSLYSSSIDVKIDSHGEGAGPGTAWIDWTLEFMNGTNSQREARAQILLPEDAVAADLTLWIDGEECEAAFGPRKAVREAYRDVAVVRRRDPALLTTCGPDRVLLQCFPIPPRGLMKTKISLCVPLCVRLGRAALRLPVIAERNFDVPAAFEHEIDVECRVRLENGSGLCLADGPARPGRSSWSARLPDRELLDPATGTLCVPVPDVGAPIVYTGSLGDHDATLQWNTSVEPLPESVCLVVDGSRILGEADVDWRVLCSAIPVSCRLNALFAGQTVSKWNDTFTPSEPQIADDLADWLSTRAYAGGCDPVPALKEAIELLAAAEGGVILWVHGPLPVRLSSTTPLVRRLSAPAQGGAEGAVELLSLSLVPGPNRVDEDLGGLAAFDRLSVCRSVEETLAFAGSNLRSNEIDREYTLTARNEAPAAPGTTSVKVSENLVRLALYEKVRSACRSGDDTRRKEAAGLAVANRLVTALSGAVVLETRAQYERHGLVAPPGTPESRIPAVPEPEEWALIVTAAVVFCYVIIRQRPRRAGIGARP